jgi:hypothetical protein
VFYLWYLEKMKQVPLHGVLCHVRKTPTCILQGRAELREIVQQLAAQAQVAGFMIDFEAAMWQALTKVCPDANKKGCVFHLTKAVWAKVQNVGLATAYNERKSVDSFVRLTALLHSIVSSTLDANYSL